MRDFRKFEVWQMSHQLTLKIYSITKLFPKEELFGLTSQIEDLSLQLDIIFQKEVAEIQIRSLLILSTSL